MGQIRIQAVKDRLTQPGRHTFGNHIDPGTDGIPLLAERIHIGFHFGNLVRIRAKERVLMHLIPVQLFSLDRAKLGEIAANTNSEPLLEELPRHRTRGHPHGRLPRRRTPATAIIADTVLVHVGVVRVGRPELLGYFRVVLRPLVGVFNQQSDGRAGGFTLKHPGENFYLVRFPALGRMPGRTRLATIQIALHIRFRELKPRRAAVDDATQCRPVALAEGGNGKQFSECISRHNSVSY